tara:strand:- start:10204 stop:10560 length:357 start_codon:yes stop_codon:yes gene_type:complete
MATAAKYDFVIGMIVYSKTFGFGTLTFLNGECAHIKTGDGVMTENRNNLVYSTPTPADDIIMFIEDHAPQVGVCCHISDDETSILLSQSLRMVTAKLSDVCRLDTQYFDWNTAISCQK